MRKPYSSASNNQTGQPNNATALERGSERIQHEEILVQQRLISMLLATAMLLTAYAGLAGLVFTSIDNDRVSSFIPIMMVLALVACGLGIMLAWFCLSSVSTSFKFIALLRKTEVAIHRPGGSGPFMRPAPIGHRSMAWKVSDHRKRYTSLVCFAVISLWLAVAFATGAFWRYWV